VSWAGHEYDRVSVVPLTAWLADGGFAEFE